jgi:hypothetical protein
VKYMATKCGKLRIKSGKEPYSTGKGKHFS